MRACRQAVRSLGSVHQFPAAAHSSRRGSARDRLSRPGFDSEQTPQTHPEQEYRYTTETFETCWEISLFLLLNEEHCARRPPSQAAEFILVTAESSPGMDTAQAVAAFHQRLFVPGTANRRLQIEKMYDRPREKTCATGE